MCYHFMYQWDNLWKILHKKQKLKQKRGKRGVFDGLQEAKGLPKLGERKCREIHEIIIEPTKKNNTLKTT